MIIYKLVIISLSKKYLGINFYIRHNIFIGDNLDSIKYRLILYYEKTRFNNMQFIDYNKLL